MESAVIKTDDMTRGEQVIWSSIRIHPFHRIEYVFEHYSDGKRRDVELAILCALILRDKREKWKR